MCFYWVNDCVRKGQFIIGWHQVFKICRIFHSDKQPELAYVPEQYALFFFSEPEGVFPFFIYLFFLSLKCVFMHDY